MWRRFFHIHTCCWEYTVGANTLHYFLNKAAIVTQWKRCNYRIVFWGVWKSKHAQNKVLKKLCQTSVLWGLSSHFWACPRQKETAMSGSGKGCRTSRSNRVDLTLLFWVLNAKNLWKHQKDPQERTKTLQSLWIAPRCTTNTWDSLGNTLWIDIICSWKQSLDLLHLHHHLRTVHVHYRTCAAVWCAG